MQNVLVRKSQPADAAQCILFMKTLAAEPDIGIGLSAGEFTLTEAQEAQFIADSAASGNSLFLVAEVGRRIVGILTLQGGKRKSTRHSATPGISVARDCRGQGAGRALMLAATDWAKANPLLRRIELFVVTSNQPAIHLYETFRFIVESHRRKALYRDGQFHDDLPMALLLEDNPKVGTPFLDEVD
jgi:RimJ/RimL family protein N-acetyltransferase